ncbi:uncharacterized protein BKA78DRAFT_358388 [Phyllosticta capitalensis]|uniref:uncharacterized protein n=1 Tax=Phyllosticta capitalensis TaxID=121624 RepID=UPI00313116FA
MAETKADRAPCSRPAESGNSTTRTPSRRQTPDVEERADNSARLELQTLGCVAVTVNKRPAKPKEKAESVIPRGTVSLAMVQTRPLTWCLGASIPLSHREDMKSCRLSKSPTPTRDRLYTADRLSAPWHQRAQLLRPSFPTTTYPRLFDLFLSLSADS